MCWCNMWWALLVSSSNIERLNIRKWIALYLLFQEQYHYC